MGDGKETQIAKLVISLQAKTDALEKGLNNAKKKLQEMEQENDNIKGKNKELEASYIAMSAVAVVSLVKISGVIKDCVNEYNSYTQAMSSLKNVSEYTGQSMEKYSEIMSKYSAYMTQTDIAATIKNFSLMGFTVEQTDQMIQALTNSAIRNRNANYTVSEAVKVASDGYKQGLSTLSDSAGVTENLSVMLDEYAKTLGKTASQLTEAEKNQAYLNRTMIASEPFASAMSDYMDTLAGKQGQYSQAMRETQVAYAEALEPTLSALTSLMTNALNVCQDTISKNKSLVAGTTTFGVTLLSVIAIIKLAKTTMSLLNATLTASPITGVIVGITALIGVTTGVITAIQEQAEKQKELNEIQERYNDIVSGTIKLSDTNMQAVKQDKESAEEYIKTLQRKMEAEKELEKSRKTWESGRWTKKGDFYADTNVKINSDNDLNEMNKALLKQQLALEKEISELEKVEKSNSNYGKSIQEVQKILEKYNDTLKKSDVAKKVTNTLDLTSVKNKQKEAAQLKINVSQNQKYLDIIKNGVKGTTEYQEAEKALAKAYSGVSSAGGIIVADAQKMINADKTKADSAWNTAQELINSYISIIKEAQNSKEIQEYVASQTGKAWKDILPELNNVLAVYEVLAGKKPSEVAGTTNDANKTTTYKNKALDNYKKQIEYKKNLDKISTEEEIRMYEYALNKLSKTNDEKMELEVQIYQLRKQLAEKEKEMLDERTKSSERWIEEQKLSAREQEEAYKRIIAYHKEYLDKMVSDERLSLEEKDKIWKEEVNTIKDYQKQIRDLKIETTNNVYEALKNALTKQADEMQEIEENAINKSLSALEKSKKQKIEMINEEYNAKIKAIDNELKALEEAENKKSRQEEEAEYEKKKKRLEDLIAYEHDAVTKSSYEKELAKLNSEYQKTLDKNALEDKKETLNNEKENLKEEQQSKLDVISEKYDKEKEYLNNRLEIIQANYDKEREMADKNAQIMLLNTQQHQTEIIDLLKTYGDEYELLGKTWGEKIVDAFEDKVQGIIKTVEDLNSQLDKAISRKMASVGNATSTSSRQISMAEEKAYINANRSTIEAIAREKGVDMGTASSMHKSGVTINQNNTFNVPAEKPSTLLQKLQKTAQNLGELVRGA